MDKKADNKVLVPSLKEIQKERKRIRREGLYWQALRGTIAVLVVVAAIAVLITTLFLPILQISGDSMSPTLEHDEIVILLKSNNFQRGDIVGFYYQGSSVSLHFQRMRLPLMQREMFTSTEKFWMNLM